MARLRQPKVRKPAHGVPIELMDRRHPVWEGNDRVAEWRRVHGLPAALPFDVIYSNDVNDPPGTNFGRGGRVRHSRALSDWALHTGITRDGQPDSIDWPRVRELTGTGRITPAQRCASRAGYDDLA